METSSESDDSIFLFYTNMPKRKAECNVRNSMKKMKLSSKNEIKPFSKIVSETENEKNKTTDGSKNESINNDFFNTGNKNNSISMRNYTSLTNEELDEDINDKKELKQEENYFSCPLCLKSHHSEATYISHMKQCAKKSKMNAKQLLDALQLHKRHLKERISAGLTNILPKKKKIHNKEEDGDSEDQLALALALSKSLEVNGKSGGENQSLTDSNYEKTTLENFGFKSSKKISTVPGKNSKNSKLTHSQLKERTKEEREKLVTEKASIVLLSNDYTAIPDEKVSLRTYHSKWLEKTRNKDSQLWGLGENFEGAECYVEDLKNILEENQIKKENYHQNSSRSEEPNIDEKISRLNLPTTTISDNWRRLINNEHLSDMSLISKDGDVFYLHSIVLYARLEKSLDLDLNTIFHKFSNSTILLFLQFLYCGKLDKLRPSEIENLFNLAESTNYQELVEILASLKRILSEPENKRENGIHRNHSEADHCSNTVENKLSSGLNNWDESDCSNLTLMEKTINWEKDLIRSSLGSAEKQEKLVTESEIIPSLSSLKEDLTCKEFLHHVEIVEEATACAKKFNSLNHVDETEFDMFADVENLNRAVEYNQDDEGNDPYCIEISSGSVKSEITRKEIAENDKDLLPEFDYEIPLFDPYEHFGSEIADTDPEERVIRSQSLIIGEISPVKLDSPKPSDKLDNTPPAISVPTCSSTPKSVICPQPATNMEFTYKKIPDHPKKRRRYESVCTKVGRRSRLSLRSRLLGSKSVKRRETGNISVEDDPEKLIGVLSESILREFDNSTGLSKTPEKNFLEVTPAVPGEEYEEEVSPLPDYSVMGASSIKKQLSRYGLKKSLSKNKAKKILRHIYEELHPIVNTKNGKIIKYIQNDKSSKKKKVNKKKVGPRKRSSISVKKKNETCCSQPETTASKETRDTAIIQKSGYSRTVAENSRHSGTSSIDSWDDYEGSSLPEESCFEGEEILSQGNYSNATDAATAIYDFIQSKPAFRRQILMYEPISLEGLQKMLLEQYNKKFKLTDLMDYLDAECITFRCVNQRRKNVRKISSRKEE